MKAFAILFLAAAGVLADDAPAPTKLAELKDAIGRIDVLPRDGGLQRREQASCYAADSSVLTFLECASSIDDWYSTKRCTTIADVTSAAACACHYVTEMYNCDIAWCPNFSTAVVSGDDYTIKSLYSTCTAAFGGGAVTTTSRDASPTRTTAASTTKKTSTTSSSEETTDSVTGLSVTKTSTSTSTTSRTTTTALSTVGSKSGAARTGTWAAGALVAAFAVLAL